MIEPHRGTLVLQRRSGDAGQRRHLPVPLLRPLGAGRGPFNPGFARQVRTGALLATIPQAFDPAPMLAR